VEKKPPLRVVLKRHWMIYLMMIPAAVLLVLFRLYPLWGLSVAFVKYSPFKGVRASPFVGLDNFVRFLRGPNALNVLRNTLGIAIGKIVVGQVVALVFALTLNEIRRAAFKRVVQTATTLPHFLSWVLIGGVMVEVLSRSGVVNKAITGLGFQAISFFGTAEMFPWTLIALETWKEFGWGAVIYLAALTGINPELYEAAAVDGAGRWARLWHISLPGIKTTIALLSCLSLGGILNAGFEQVWVFLNPMVTSTGEILDTYIYRVGLLTGEISLAAAVGLFKSLVGFGLVWLSYWLADRFANYRIF
jgi:putative aldouronate transport system permease protein